MWCRGSLSNLYEAAVARDMNRVEKLHQQAIQFDNAVYRTAEDPHNPLRGLKAALSIMGICGTAMTPPLRPITNAERDGIERHLDAIGQRTTAR